MSAWNDFVKKIYWENKKKNKDFQFKDALKEASARKGEMKSMTTPTTNSGKGRSSSRKSSTQKGGKPRKRKTRKNRKR